MTHPRRGITFPLRIEPDMVLDALFSGLYSAEDIEVLPFLILQLVEGNEEMLKYLISYFYLENGIDEGASLVYSCFDEDPYIDEDRFRKDLEQTTSPYLAYQAPYLLASLKYDLCKTVEMPVAPEHFFQPYVISVPALAIVGDLDPITPPSWTHRLAEGQNPGFWQHTFSGYSHAVLSRSRCAGQLSKVFLQNLDSPDANWRILCLNSQREIVFDSPNVDLE